MRQTDQTLLEQLRITDLELETRKALYGLTQHDVEVLTSVRGTVEQRLDIVVDRFYEAQTAVPDIALLIGDADTLVRLRNAQRRYLQGLFTGSYNLEYVNNRLRIGLVHKRIGVEPKLYLAAVHTLESLLIADLADVLDDPALLQRVTSSLRKLVMFDIALVFETYIRSLVAEIETSKDRSEAYARSLEDKVRERTLQLEAMNRTDSLTGLISGRHLRAELADALYRASRRLEPVAVAYLDIDGFKQINDTQGHAGGDAVLSRLGTTIREIAREEDLCFRNGGDELCIVLPNCTSDGAQSTFVSRLVERLAEVAPEVTISAGCADTGSPDYLGPDELIQAADAAMYEAKRASRAAPAGT